jgi:hypothetical protein
MKRLVSFDANGDDRLAPDELPERMAGLMKRGDKNRDGFLTINELIPLVDTGLKVPVQANMVARRFDDLATVIADLKLPADTHNQVVAIVKARRNLSESERSELYSTVRKLLNDEDYENFVAAVARLRASARGFAGGVAGNMERMVID